MDFELGFVAIEPLDSVMDRDDFRARVNCALTNPELCLLVVANLAMFIDKFGIVAHRRATDYLLKERDNLGLSA